MVSACPLADAVARTPSVPSIYFHAFWWWSSALSQPRQLPKIITHFCIWRPLFLRAVVQSTHASPVVVAAGAQGAPSQWEGETLNQKLRGGGTGCAVSLALQLYPAPPTQI